MNEIGQARSTKDREEKYMQDLVRKPEKRSTGRPRRRWEITLK